jgi:hypothetical protein
MKNIFLLFLAFSAFGQDPQPQTGALRITWPLNRTVLQMGANNQASINVAGQHVTYELYPTFLRVRQLQYKIVKLDTKTGADVSDVTNGYEDINGSEFNNDISSKDLRTFLKTITLSKGWYRLQIRIRRSFITGFKTIQRQDVLFGVGDVYLIAGQSNAQGYQQESGNATPNPNNGDDNGIVQNSNNYEPRNAVSVIDRKILPDDEGNTIPIQIKGW